ncbi:group II intron reverse transcriptase/maturase [uncultured Cohaesibacter sp.]|uniref:group II intron reverse transcriptase/maturase n=1 Tax=uncultured Cohaesibacter sp. TaxID=1002546 RepID=UPI0029C6C915|nr:group II intron reverse transcriptase/maturase [uncultured Cohaesibacter sp.]
MIISELQNKLATWAEKEPDRRFDRLLRLIANRDWLAESARIVLASSGARTPGIDGMDKRRLQIELDHHLANLRVNLLNGSYCPQPVKRIYIPKSNGKLRPLGIPTLIDRIVQRAMLMVMEPIWESDFHRLSYGFRPERSVHHAVRTVKIQLQDCGETRGRWVIEGDLASYFDTVHHRLLITCVRQRIRDRRFVELLWRILKSGHIDRGLFKASSEGVPQGGVLSPLLSNIMLHEFDMWLEAKYLNKKARKDRWAWNFGIKQGRPIAVRENRQWKPAAAYCRYADDFVVIVKGTKAHAMKIREECRAFLEGRLKLTLNMEKTHITHVNDGFVFLGHRIIRKRGKRGQMSVVTTIPKEKAKGFVHKLTQTLSGNHSISAVNMVDRLNRQLAGWAAFYKFTDFTAYVFQRIDSAVFWKMAHWLGCKYRSRIKPLMRKWFRAPQAGKAKTWLIYGISEQGHRIGKDLRRLVASPKAQFRWRNPDRNPYIFRMEDRSTITSRYYDVAMAMGQA